MRRAPRWRKANRGPARRRFASGANKFRQIISTWSSGSHAGAWLHLLSKSFKFLLGFGLGGFADPDRIADVLFAMFRHHLHPDTRGSLGNRGKLDEIGDQTEIRQTTRNEAGKTLRSHLYPDDRGGVAIAFKACV